MSPEAMLGLEGDGKRGPAPGRGPSARSLEVNQMPSALGPTFLKGRDALGHVTVEHLDPRVWLRGVARAGMAGDPQKQKRDKEKESHA